MNKQMKIVVIILAIILCILLGIFIYFKVTYISKADVKSNISNYINANSDDIFYENIDLDIDSGLYEVDIYYQNQEYEFKIDAKKGSVVQTDYRKQNAENTTNQENTTTQSTPSPSSSTEVTEQEAKNIAFTDANVKESDVQRLRVEKEEDDQRIVYEIDFQYGEYEYDYKIQASDGQILEYDRDHIYE